MSPGFFFTQTSALGPRDSSRFWPMSENRLGVDWSAICATDHRESVAQAVECGGVGSDRAHVRRRPRFA
jgi:hypothetical protein